MRALKKIKILQRNLKLLQIEMVSLKDKSYFLSNPTKINESDKLMHSNMKEQFELIQQIMDLERSRSLFSRIFKW